MKERCSGRPRLSGTRYQAHYKWSDLNNFYVGIDKQKYPICNFKTQNL